MSDKIIAASGFSVSAAHALEERGKLYGVIYADPPWSYNLDYEGNSRSVTNQYQTMSIADICALKVPAAADCVLYLWAVTPLLPEALDVIKAWGFKYKSCAVWDKVKLGMGYWFRGQHELLLVGRAVNHLWADWLKMDAEQLKLLPDIRPLDVPCGCFDGDDATK